MAPRSTIDDFGVRGSDAFMQSVVVDVAVSDDLNYSAQPDLLCVGSTGADGVGLDPYLF